MKQFGAKKGIAGERGRASKCTGSAHAAVKSSTLAWGACCFCDSPAECLLLPNSSIEHGAGLMDRRGVLKLQRCDLRCARLCVQLDPDACKLRHVVADP